MDHWGAIEWLVTALFGVVGGGAGIIYKSLCDKIESSSKRCEDDNNKLLVEIRRLEDRLLKAPSLDQIRSEIKAETASIGTEQKTLYKLIERQSAQLTKQSEIVNHVKVRQQINDANNRR